MTDDESRDGRRSTSDEPLGDLAEAVRERTGDRTPGDRSASRREGPLADVAAAVDERRARGGTDDAYDAFESVDVGDLDGEQLWEELAERDAAEADSVAAPTRTDAADAADVESDRDVRTIPKGTCQGCPHLSEPPEVACTHDGTDILRMVDTDHFRVADCPIVDDDEELDLRLGADGSSEGDASAAADSASETEADG